MAWLDHSVNLSTNCFVVSIFIFTNVFDGQIGDVIKRLCTAAEVKFYAQLLTSGGGRGNLKPNRNCNLSAWPLGCEPGWACRVGGYQVHLKDTMEMPPRILDCQPCCEGFFCPRGLTCMIRKYLQEY